MKELIIKMYEKQGYSPVGIAKEIGWDIQNVWEIIYDHFYIDDPFVKRERER